MKKNDLYNGFRVLDIADVPDCNSTGIYLKHERTGLEVFHLLNDDTENTFAFAFRTPSQNSTGVAHVLEHSVLCGSEKYPLKDPFLRLTNQSVNTYLNAYTAADRTVFPASSLIKADYFNMMSVYGDAVFFPLLKNEIFLQECWRLEYDKNGRPEIQGVVYNEMKGAFSSFDNVSLWETQNAVCPGSFYKYSSGGDPMVIPSLNLKMLRDFHKKNYVPANCLLFLYGNIPTEEQLDFVEKQFLSRIKNPGKPCKFPKEDKNISIKSKVRAFGPSDNSQEAQNVVSRIWRVDDAASSVELIFLGDLLWGDQCAPVAKALIDSKLGKDLANIPGESINNMIWSSGVGLRGVKKEDESKVDALILGTLKELCKNGISREDIERTSLSFNFLNREIIRMQGPFSHVILRRVLRSWTYGESPYRELNGRKEFEIFKNKIDRNPEYLKELINKFYLSNKKTSFVVVEPSESWTKKRILEEKKIADSILKNLGKEKVYENLNLMHKFQAMDESSKSTLIPSVKVSDLSDKIEDINMVKKTVSGVPLYYCREHTNGIVYVKILFPADVVNAEDYVYLPAIASCIGEVGWKNADWDKAQSLIKSVSLGIGTGIVSRKRSGSAAKNQHKENLIADRNWLGLEMKFLEEDTDKALGIFSECILNTDFSDINRVKFILDSMEQGIKESVSYNAHAFAISRVNAMTFEDSALNELWSGITQYDYIKKINRMPEEELQKKLSAVYKKIISSGAILQMTCNTDSFNRSKNALEKFTETLKLKPPVSKKIVSHKKLYNLVDVFGTGTKDEIFIMPGTVGYAACSLEGSDFGTKDYVAERIYAHNLETGALWSKVRMEGGAYGVFFFPSSSSEKIIFGTYRDPKPFESFKALEEAIKEENLDFSQEATDKAITGLYADSVEPMTPYIKGRTGLNRILTGVSAAMVKKNLKYLLSMKHADVVKASKRVKKAEYCGKKVVFCPREFVKNNLKETSGKIIDLSL